MSIKGVSITPTRITGRSVINHEKGVWLTLLFCGLFLTATSGASLWLQLDALLAGCLLVGSFAAPFLFRWLVINTSFIGAVIVLGVVFMSGFMGSFVGVIDFIAPLYNRVRWVVPLFVFGIALLHIALARNFWHAMQRPWGGLATALLLFLGYALLSVPYSSAPLTTLGRAATFTAVTFGTGGTLYYIVQNVEQVERLLICIALLMALVILPGELYLFFPNSIGWHSSGRFRSTFWNPVTFAHLCTVLLPLYWWLTVRPRESLLQRLAAGGMVGILFLNLLLAGSRGAALALSVVVTLLAWRFVGRRVRWLLLAFSFLVLVIVLPLQKDEVIAFFTRGASWNDNYYFYSGRLASWQRAFELWSQSPVIGFGFGSIGNTDTVLLGTDSTNVTTVASNTAALRLSNLYLETLAAGGVIGVSLLLYLLFRAFRTLTDAMHKFAVRARSARGSEQQLLQRTQSLLTMALATFIGGLVLNFTETWLISAGSPYAMYWWLVLFLAIRVITIVKETGEIAEETTVKQTVRE